MWPALMTSDSGTDAAVAGAYALFSASIFFILSGIFGKWSLFAAAWFTVVVCFIPFPDKIHNYIMVTLVPTVMVLAFLFAFGWIGSRGDPVSDATMLHPLDSASEMPVVNETDDGLPTPFSDVPAIV